MKLRNKKTGEIVEVESLYLTQTQELYLNYINEENKQKVYTTDKIASFNLDWEDYEEPKEYWYIDPMVCGVYCTKIKKDEDLYDFNKQIGNYFETKEEAEKAVEKLKAWHKLMDYWGTEVLGWEIRDMPTGGNWQTVNVKFNVKTRKEPMELLDIVFGGEE